MRPKNTLRWIALVPASIFGWYVALLVGILFVSALDYLCPPEQIVSGHCMAPWYTPAFNVLVVIFSGISAVFAILGGYLLAPHSKLKAALAIYVIGLLIALWAAVEADLLAAFVSAAIFGGATVIVLRGRNRNAINA